MLSPKVVSFMESPKVNVAGSASPLEVTVVEVFGLIPPDTYPLPAEISLTIVQAKNEFGSGPVPLAVGFD